MALRRSLQPWLHQHMHLVQQFAPAQHSSLFSSKAAPPPQQEQTQAAQGSEGAASTSAAAAPKAPTAANTIAPAAKRPKAAEEEWTEVVDEKTGQIYFWNEKTGETTDLGEPRPKTRFRDQEWEQAAQQGPFQDGWREPPGRDHTYFYSVLGVAVGVAAGWFTQYLH